MIYGPICGLTIGFFSDVLGHVLFQSSTQFFFGYTINAMLAGLIYGLLFYRTKVTFTKCLASRILVNTIINVFLGTIWWKMLYGLSSLLVSLEMTIAGNASLLPLSTGMSV